MTLPPKRQSAICLVLALTIGLVVRGLSQQPSLASQDSSDVSVVVTDQNGAFIGGAEIAITDTATGSEIGRGRTNENGEVVIKVTAGECYVRARHPGFLVSVITNVRIQPPSPARLNITMHPGESLASGGPDGPPPWPLEAVQLPDLRVPEKPVPAHASNSENGAELFNRNNLPPNWMYPQSGLKQRLRELAGKDAVNCGRASRSSLKPTNVSECALQKYASKESFYARYDLEGGIDVDLAIGFASDGQKVYAVTSWRPISWDGEATQPRLEVGECPVPVKLAKTQSGRLDCFSHDPKARPKILSQELGY